MKYYSKTLELHTILSKIFAEMESTGETKRLIPMRFIEGKVDRGWQGPFGPREYPDTLTANKRIYADVGGGMFVDASAPVFDREGTVGVILTFELPLHQDESAIQISWEVRDYMKAILGWKLIDKGDEVWVNSGFNSERFAANLEFKIDGGRKTFRPQLEEFIVFNSSSPYKRKGHPYKWPIPIETKELITTELNLLGFSDFSG